MKAIYEVGIKLDTAGDILRMCTVLSLTLNIRTYVYVQVYTYIYDTGWILLNGPTDYLSLIKPSLYRLVRKLGHV